MEIFYWGVGRVKMFAIAWCTHAYGRKLVTGGMKISGAGVLSRLLLALVLISSSSAVFAQTVFAFSSVEGDWVGQGETKAYTPATADFYVSSYETIFNNASGKVVTISVHGLDNGDSWFIDLAVPRGQILAPGQYHNAERAAFRTGRSPGLEFGGNGRGCNQIWGDFEIRQVELDSDGEVSLLEATFVQRCESADAPLVAGLIRWKASQMSMTLQGPLLAPSVNAEFYGDTTTFSLWGNVRDGLSYFGSGQRDEWDISILPPFGKELKVGTYVTDVVPTSTRAGMQLSGLSSCLIKTGKLDIKRMRTAPNGDILKLYATFEQRCAGVPGSLFGTIHYGI